MTDIHQDQTQSCIKTKCAIDKKEVLKWLLARFPELAHDAVLDAVQDNFTGSITFTIEHTRQPPVQVGPILLSDPNKEIADAEFQG